MGLSSAGVCRVEEGTQEPLCFTRRECEAWSCPSCDNTPVPKVSVFEKTVIHAEMAPREYSSSVHAPCLRGGCCHPRPSSGRRGRDMKLVTPEGPQLREPEGLLLGLSCVPATGPIRRAWLRSVGTARLPRGSGMIAPTQRTGALGGDRTHPNLQGAGQGQSPRPRGCISA